MARPRTLARSWRDLVAEARARGVTRRADDTTATLAARLAEAEDVAGTSVRIQPALIASAATLDALTRTITRVGGRRVAADVALVPGTRLGAIRRAARRRGIRVQPFPTAPPDPEPAVLAAAVVVRALAESLAWPSWLRPPALAAVEPPADPNGAQQMWRLEHAWLAALDSALDPAAEASPPPARSRRGIRATLEAARAAGRPVDVRYRAAGAITARTIVPLRWERRTSTWYLHAYCELRRAERLFRLDRILTAASPDPR